MGCIGITGPESVAQIQADLGVTATVYADVYNAVPALWDSFADKASFYPRLQYAYTRREAADMLLGALRTNVDAERLHSSVTLSQLFGNAEKIRGLAQDLVNEIEGKLSANLAPVTGLITNRTGRQVPPCSPNPSNPGYRGDPLIDMRPPETFG